MLSRNQVKYLHSLRLKKFRDANRTFLAEGVKLTGELINSNLLVQKIFATPEWILENRKLVTDKDIDLQEITPQELGKISNLVTPNEVLALVSYREPTDALPDDSPQLILILDRIQDPGNLGTIIRTADWFGIRQVFCSEDTADVYNPKVVQATMGSICRINVRYLEIKDLLNDLGPKWKIYGTTPDGENIYRSNLLFPAAVMIGNESQGIRGEYLPLVTGRLGIPAVSTGAESLNASVAAGIVVSEFVRRLGPGS